MSSESSDEGDKGDTDFIPKLKVKRMNTYQQFKAVGGKKHTQKVKKDTNYMFCPLPH
jgi:hypothetical protein